MFKSIGSFFRTLGTILQDACQDETGHYSHARIIAMLVAIGATVFMWKLVFMGGMTIEYFMGYLTYGTAHQTLNKYLDGKSINYSRQSDTADKVIDKIPDPDPGK